MYALMPVMAGYKDILLLTGGLCVIVVVAEQFLMAGGHSCVINLCLHFLNVFSLCVIVFFIPRSTSRFCEKWRLLDCETCTKFQGGL